MFIDLENSEFTGSLFAVKTIDNAVVIGNKLTYDTAIIYATLVFNKVHFRNNTIRFTKEFTEIFCGSYERITAYFNKTYNYRYMLIMKPDDKMRMAPEYKKLINTYYKHGDVVINTRCNDNYFIGKNV